MKSQREISKNAVIITLMIMFFAAMGMVIHYSVKCDKLKKQVLIATIEPHYFGSVEIEVDSIDMGGIYSGFSNYSDTIYFDFSGSDTIYIEDSCYASVPVLLMPSGNSYFYDTQSEIESMKKENQLLKKKVDFYFEFYRKYLPIVEILDKVDTIRPIYNVPGGLMQYYFKGGPWINCNDTLFNE